MSCVILNYVFYFCYNYFVKTTTKFVLLRFTSLNVLQGLIILKLNFEKKLGHILMVRGSSSLVNDLHPHHELSVD